MAFVEVEEEEEECGWCVGVVVCMCDVVYWLRLPWAMESGHVRLHVGVARENVSMR